MDSCDSRPVMWSWRTNCFVTTGEGLAQSRRRLLSINSSSIANINSRFDLFGVHVQVRTLALQFPRYDNPETPVPQPAFSIRLPDSSCCTACRMAEQPTLDGAGPIPAATLSKAYCSAAMKLAWRCNKQATNTSNPNRCPPPYPAPPTPCRYYGLPERA